MDGYYMGLPPQPIRSASAGAGLLPHCNSDRGALLDGLGDHGRADPVEERVDLRGRQAGGYGRSKTI